MATMNRWVITWLGLGLKLLKGCISMADCEKCMEENRISALEKDSERNSAQHREFYGKFNDVDVKQAVADEKYSQILTIQKSMDDKLTKLTETPCNRWNTLINGAIGALVAGLVALAVSGIFG
jgi:hypothetical protein